MAYIHGSVVLVGSVGVVRDLVFVTGLDPSLKIHA